MTNPSFNEDWIKIEKSKQTPEEFQRKVAAADVPRPFEIYAAKKTSSYHEVEAIVSNMIRPRLRYDNIPCGNRKRVAYKEKGKLFFLTYFISASCKIVEKFVTTFAMKKKVSIIVNYLEALVFYRQLLSRFMRRAIACL